MTILKFEGNFIEVCDALGFSKEWYESSSKKEYQDTIALDLQRICYVSFHQSVETMQARLQDISHLNDTFSYSQGNFTGEVFTGSCILGIKKDFPIVSFDESVSFYFEDAEHRLAFSILRAYVPNGNNKKNPLLVCSIIENPYLAPKDRRVTLFIDQSVLEAFRVDSSMESQQDGSEIPFEALASEIQDAIPSKELQSLVQGVITKKGFQPEVFDALKLRVFGPQNHKANQHNIDLYEFKDRLVQEFLKIYPEAKQPQSLQTLLREMQDHHIWHRYSFEHEFIPTCESNFLTNPSLTGKEKEALKNALYELKRQYIQEMARCQGTLLSEDIERQLKEDTALIDTLFQKYQPPKADEYQSSKLWTFSERNAATLKWGMLGLIIGVLLAPMAIGFGILLFTLLATFLSILEGVKSSPKASVKRLELAEVFDKKQVTIVAENIETAKINTSKSQSPEDEEAKLLPSVV